MTLLLCQCDLFDSAGSLFVSEQDEMELGAEFDSQLRNTDSGKVEFPVYNANTATKLAFQNYVTSLADSIVKAIPSSEKPGYSFKFTLIDKNIVNAFAVPGGYVYIYTGIIKNMQDESELAGVLGHEISHVTLHHYRDAMMKDAALSLLVKVLVGNDSSQLKQLVAGSLYQLAALKVSRSNESEADESGTRYEGAIGRNPMGIAKFFSRMSDQIPDWISTHPAPEDRVAAVTAEVNGDATLKAIAADSARTNYKSRFVQYAKDPNL